MNNFVSAKLSCVFCLLSVLYSGTVFAAWTNGQAAVTVLGEPDFSTITGGVTATALAGPAATCLDPTTGALWVSDYNSNRILMWSATDKLVDGSAATKVLGQPDFTSSASGVTASTLNHPLGCAFDNHGNLYVSDYYNYRVLRFNSAASKANGAAADLVFGQADFTSKLANRGGIVAANSLSSTWGVFVDSKGNLWVTDAGNNRVLRYDDPLNKANGAAADFVLGQADFTSQLANRGGTASANTLASPFFLALDNNETLLVTDSSNSRVLKWKAVYTKTNGADADGVLGQADFTSVLANRGGTAGANTLSNRLLGVGFDSFGGVYVADSNNHRILYFVNGTSKSDGADADKVLGQPDFTTTTLLSASSTTLGNEILGPVFDRKLGRIWVTGYAFKRVIAFYDKSLTSGLYFPVRGSNNNVNILFTK